VPLIAATKFLIEGQPDDSAKAGRRSGTRPSSRASGVPVDESTLSSYIPLRRNLKADTRLSQQASPEAIKQKIVEDGSSLILNDLEHYLEDDVIYEAEEDAEVEEEAPGHPNDLQARLEARRLEIRRNREIERRKLRG
jgi:hypothetical protein